MAPADVLIEIGAQGKPFLGAIAARTDLQFNLAHSGELALVAVTRGCPVGVDVERLRPIEHWTEIASRYFHPAEVAAIAASIEGERNTGFLRCWTQKEAILKAFGVGLGHSLQSFAVPVLEQSGQWVELDALAGATPRRYWLRSLVPSAGYVAAVATSVERKMMAGLVGEF
jgi:4'-phosphopantetheinyl transferase